MTPQCFRSTGADGEKYAGLKASAQRFCTTHSSSDLKQMYDLDGGGKQHNIRIVARDAENAFAQRLDVLWKGPLVKGNSGYAKAVFGESKQELRIGGGVLLDGNAHF